jgi:DNA-binding CsgD family transcriptional regulator
MTCALSGQAATARAMLKEAPELDSPLFSSAADLYLAWAWTAVASGDLPRARVLIEQAVGRARRTGDLVGEAVAWHAAARLGTPKPSIAHLERLAEVIEGELTGWRAAHARALAEGDADALEDVSEALAGMGADLLAAEAAADAAVQWHRRGEARRAAAAERLAGVLSGRCEGARTPALQAVRSRAELTSAERDAATMAAEGRANREIAEALGLSVRTIENQLQRAYAKLGVSRRSDLAQALEGSPAEPG